MARFNVSGLQDFRDQLDKLSQLDDEDAWRIVSAGAAVLERLYSSRLAELFRVVTGALSASIKVQKGRSGDSVCAIVTPAGKHPRSGTGKRKKKHGSGGGSYTGTNTEIAFILEYGSARIPARHWMEKANKEAEEAVTQAMAEEWNKILDELGL